MVQIMIFNLLKNWQNNLRDNLNVLENTEKNKTFSVQIENFVIKIIQKKIDSKKIDSKTFKFSNDINKFILLLSKGVHPYDFIDD